MVLVSDYAFCRELACRCRAEKFVIREYMKISVPDTIATEDQRIEAEVIRAFDVGGRMVYGLATPQA
jgi:hypothetical protein